MTYKKQDHLCFGQVQGHKIHNNRIYSNNNNWGQSGQSEGSHFTILSINSIYFSWYRSFTYPPGRVPLITFCLRCIFTQKWSFSYSWLFSVQSSTALSTTTGWSFATAIFYIILTGIKKQQNHITQSFLSTSYIDILIFGGLTMVRCKKVMPFRAVPK